MWTFETQWPADMDASLRWRQSSQRFDTAERASVEAAAWMAVCALNEIIVLAKLVEVES